jgi:osmotically-inducible protein OsmY
MNAIPPLYHLDGKHTLDHRIHSAIKANPFISKRRLRFENRQGHVTLQGKVESYFEKQMAQEALRNVAGIDSICNQLEVIDSLVTEALRS